jgi:hypothetical protein
MAKNPEIRGGSFIGVFHHRSGTLVQGRANVPEQKETLNLMKMMVEELCGRKGGYWV